MTDHATQLHRATETRPAWHLRALALVDDALVTMAADIAAGDAAGRAHPEMRATTSRAFAAALLKRAIDALERLAKK